ncbi:MAG: T9SS type A sorting domain-containing protein [Lewinellaceae bacterium]|nr:T9SS type A sorting domain-containing protein [Lewinellaceae bacterium]
MFSSAPAIVDLDGDNLPDVVMGERNGNVNYFKNTGTPTEPQYASLPTIQVLGGISTTVIGEVVGFSTPSFIRKNDGSIMLVVGSQGGPFKAYDNVVASGTPFTLISDQWGGLDEGNRTHPAFADFNNDGILEMVVGNFRGGLSLFKTELADCSVGTNQASAVLDQLGLYASPNPADQQLTLTVSNASGSYRWVATNSMGQRIATGEQNSSSLVITTSDWANGVYFIQVLDKNGKKRGVKKVVIAR